VRRRLTTKEPNLKGTTMTETTMTADTFATGLKAMSFFDVQRIVDAINASRNARSAVDGMTLMRAADLILNPTAATADPKPARKPRTVEPPAPNPARP